MNDPPIPSFPWVAAPAILAVLACIGAIRTDRPLPVVVGLSIVVLVGSGALAWRRIAGWPLLAGLTLPAAGVVLACYGDPRNVGWFGACVIVGWAALASAPAAAASAGAIMAAIFALQFATVAAEPGWITWIAGTAFTTGACIFARRQGVLVERLRAAQAELAERARTDERHRIAREMHDLVGHSLTVTLLHLGSSRLALDDDLDAARASLAEAERAARNSLDDVRAAVGLMRARDPLADRPAPTAAGITGLVQSYRAAGARIDLTVRGDPARLTPSAGLAAFRVVQESLTNAVRHGGHPISVRISVTDTNAHISVRNAAPARGPGGTGTGIAAMHERVGALGGHVTVGPDGRDWLVEAVIPG